MTTVDSNHFDLSMFKPDWVPSETTDLAGRQANPIDVLACQSENGPETKLLRGNEIFSLERPPELIEDVLDQQTVNFMIAKPGRGKTFVALDMALSIGFGLPWCGHKVTQGKVLFVAAEGAYTLEERILGWCAQHEIVPDLEGRLDIYPDRFNFLKDNDVDSLKSHLQQDGPYNFIVLDTVARSVPGGNENSPEVMGKFFDHCSTIRHQFDLTVLGVHHPGRKGEHSRGHSSIDGNEDTEFRIEGNLQQGIKVIHSKVKNKAEMKPKAFKLKVFPSGHFDGFDAIKYKHGLPTLEQTAIDNITVEETAKASDLKILETFKRLIDRAPFEITRVGINQSLYWDRDIEPSNPFPVKRTLNVIDKAVEDGEIIVKSVQNPQTKRSTKGYALAQVEACKQASL